MKQIGKAVGVAAGLAALQALAPYADEILIGLSGVLPTPIAPLIVTALAWLLKSPFASK